jgi:hypothetical protein
LDVPHGNGIEMSVMSHSLEPKKIHKFVITHKTDISINKMVVDESNIEMARLIVVGDIISTLYDGDSFDLLRECYGMEDLPFHMIKDGINIKSYMATEVEIRYKAPTQTERLVYYYTEPNEKAEHKLVYDQQYTEGSGYDKFFLPINHNIVCFLVKTDILCDDITIVVHGNVTLKLNKIKESNGYGMYLLDEDYEFGSNEEDKTSHGLHFSLIDHSAMKFPDGMYECKMIAIGLNVMDTKLNGLSYSA